MPKTPLHVRISPVIAKDLEAAIERTGRQKTELVEAALRAYLDGLATQKTRTEEAPAPPNNEQVAASIAQYTESLERVLVAQFDRLVLAINTQTPTQKATQPHKSSKRTVAKKTKLTGGRPGRVLTLDGIEATLSEHLRRLLPGVEKEKLRATARSINKAINRGEDPAAVVARFVARYRAGAG